MEEQEVNIPVWYENEEACTKAMANRLLGIFYVVYFYKVGEGIGYSKYSVVVKTAANEKDAIRQAEETMRVVGFQKSIVDFDFENYKVQWVEKRKR